VLEGFFVSIRPAVSGWLGGAHQSDDRSDQDRAAVELESAVEGAAKGIGAEGIAAGSAPEPARRVSGEAVKRSEDQERDRP
jgi:hypothetical protein